MGDSISKSSKVSMDSEKKLNLPDNTAFRQQRLPAWQPIMTPTTALPVFFAVSILFIPIGIILLLASDGVTEYIYDYTNCVSLENPTETCSFVRLNQLRMNETCTCELNFNLDVQFIGNVYVYYGLSNFYQNHRRYVKSRDDNQLIGTHVTVSSISGECTPYATTIVNGVLRPIAPCGAIANSMFNDTYSLSKDSTPVPILRTGIAWPTDYEVKFNNPPPTTDLNVAFSTYEKPLFWQTPAQFLDNSSVLYNGYKNEPFIVWMRTAAFPHFQKPYGRLNRNDINFANGLEIGQYTLTINYNFPVTAYFGQKRFILSTTSWMGGKNNFLGIAYICVGSICFVVGLFLCFLHYYTKKVNVIQVSDLAH